MRINNNLMAMNTHRQLGINNTGTSKSLEKLSSGFKINRAGDDAAGLAISEKMRGQIRGLNMASKNAQDGISLIQTAEGALNETHSILQRMRELAVQSATDTNTGVDRGEIQKEIDELAKEVTRIAETTEFNTQKLLDGSYKEMKFHIGANAAQDVDINIGSMKSTDLEVGVAEAEVVEGKIATATGSGVTITAKADGIAGDDVTVKLVAATASGQELKVSVLDKAITINLGSKSGAIASTSTASEIAAAINSHAEASKLVTATGESTVKATGGDLKTASGVDAVHAGINVSTQSEASAAITTIQSAIENVSAERSKLGAMQNRLEHTIKNVDNTSENLQAAESRIRDVDMAKEMMEFTKQNILQQAATAMLAQANNLPQGVLQLLR